jgi:hypothetical protein
MKMIVTGIVAAIVIAAGANFFMRAQGNDRSAWQVYSTPSARVADPGQNLVGPAWTGEGEAGATGSAEPAS